MTDRRPSQREVIAEIQKAASSVPSWMFANNRNLREPVTAPKQTPKQTK
jgi:hypothetical protein